MQLNRNEEGKMKLALNKGKGSWSLTIFVIDFI